MMEKVTVPRWVGYQWSPRIIPGSEAEAGALAAILSVIRRDSGGMGRLSELEVSLADAAKVMAEGTEVYACVLEINGEPLFKVRLVP